MRNSRLNERTVKQQKNVLASTDRVQKTHLEIRMTHHNAAVALKSGGREAFGEGVSDHKVGTQRHELD
jgi:hypothetical protein